VRHRLLLPGLGCFGRAGQGHIEVMDDDRVAEDGSEEELEDEPLSQSSQIGRTAQTGGTPESRRTIDDDEGEDGDRWRAPREESEPISES
jgi:hypothetical protein